MQTFPECSKREGSDKVVIQTLSASSNCRRSLSSGWRRWSSCWGQILWLRFWDWRSAWSHNRLVDYPPCCKVNLHLNSAPSPRNMPLYHCDVLYTLMQQDGHWSHKARGVFYGVQILDSRCWLSFAESREYRCKEFVCQDLRVSCRLGERLCKTKLNLYHGRGKKKSTLIGYRYFVEHLCCASFSLCLCFQSPHAYPLPLCLIVLTLRLHD